MRKTVTCFINGKKLSVPNVDKVIVAIRDENRQHIQASMDMIPENIKLIKKTIRRVP